MSTILYSLAGEGRGHATRVQAVVESLRAAGDHRIVLLAPHDAYALLTARYGRTPGVVVRRIPGLIFHYRGHRIDPVATAAAFARYLRNLPALIDEIDGIVRRERPDLAIADFEPALPRAAVRCGLPLVSLDHQHLFGVSDLSFLPGPLRRHAWMIRAAARWYCPAPDRTLVCSFRFPAARRGHENGDRVVRLGPLLRPAVRDAVPVTGDHLLVYLRPNTADTVLPVLRRCGREARVYGVGPKADDGNLRFRPIDEATFTEDMRTCWAYVGGAGNQTLSETLTLGKPALVLPERNHHEQRINGHLLRNGGGGDFRILDDFGDADLAAFATNRDRHAAAAGGVRPGNDDAVRVLFGMMSGKRRPALIRSS